MAQAAAGLLTLAVAMGIGRFAFTPVLPMMLQDAGLSLAQGSWLASANYLGYLLGALAAIMLRSRPGVVIRWGLLAIAILTGAMGLPLPLTAWLLLRLLAGVASAWVLIAVSAWSMDALAPYGRPLLGSMVFAGVGCGIAAAGMLCILLLRLHAGSPQAWFTFGVLSLLATALVWPLFARASGVAAPASAACAASPWTGAVLRRVLCYGLFGFGYIIPATFLPVMARQALHDTSLFAWSWPVFGAAAALSTLAVAPLVRHLDHRRLWMLSQAVMALGTALPALAAGPLAVFAAALCVGGTFMVLTLAALQEARRVAGVNAATVIAAMTAAFAAGQIIGPLTVRSGSFSNALLLAALLLVAGIFLLRDPAAARAPQREGT
jgi:MFS family permease